MSISQNFGVNH